MRNAEPLTFDEKLRQWNVFAVGDSFSLSGFAVFSFSNKCQEFFFYSYLFCTCRANFFPFADFLLFEVCKIILKRVSSKNCNSKAVSIREQGLCMSVAETACGSVLRPKCSV